MGTLFCKIRQCRSVISKAENIKVVEMLTQHKFKIIKILLHFGIESPAFVSL